MKSHYDVLKLEKNCKKEDIRQAFVCLSKKLHPDRNKRSDASEKFIEIKEAYRVLINDKTRKQYDESLKFFDQRNPVMDQTKRPIYRTVDPCEYYRAKYSGYRENQSFQNRNSLIFSRKNIIIAFVCVFIMSMGSTFEMRRAIKKKNYQNHLTALAILKTMERDRLWGRDKVLELRKNHLYHPVSVREVLEELEKVKKGP